MDADAINRLIEFAQAHGTPPSYIVLNNWSGPLLRSVGLYDPSHPMAFLDYVKRTSPKPKLRYGRRTAK